MLFKDGQRRVTTALAMYCITVHSVSQEKSGLKISHQ